MPKENLATQLLIEQFPEWAHAIQRLFERDAEFQEICADYFRARRALTYWSTPPERATDLAKEYRRLVRSLEDEILEALEGREEKDA
jgi:hypothetical protein